MQNLELKNLHLLRLARRRDKEKPTSKECDAGNRKCRSKEEGGDDGEEQSLLSDEQFAHRLMAEEEEAYKRSVDANDDQAR